MTTGSATGDSAGEPEELAREHLRDTLAERLVAGFEQLAVGGR